MAILTSDEFARSLTDAIRQHYQEFYIDVPTQDEFFDVKDIVTEGNEITVTIDTVRGGESQRFSVIVRG